MATVAGIKIKAKVSKARNPIFFDEKYTGTEPEWDTEKAKGYTDAEFDHQLRQSFYYYNYYYSQKDCKKYVVAWMQSTTEFTKEEIKAFALFILGEADLRGSDSTSCTNKAVDYSLPYRRDSCNVSATIFAKLSVWNNLCLSLIRALHLVVTVPEFPKTRRQFASLI